MKKRDIRKLETIHKKMSELLEQTKQIVSNEEEFYPEWIGDLEDAIGSERFQYAQLLRGNLWGYIHQDKQTIASKSKEIDPECPK